MTGRHPVPSGHALIGGRPVPLADCAWVLRRRCGCAASVVYGDAHPAQADAWLALCGGWLAVMRALRRGERLELADQADPRLAEALGALLGGPCPHQRDAGKRRPAS